MVKGFPKRGGGVLTLDPPLYSIKKQNCRAGADNFAMGAFQTLANINRFQKVLHI